MIEYQGIKRESLFLMADNRFRDSKEFYEEHKEELKSGMTEPMRQIAAIIGEELFSLDELMQTNPVKMVSRIYRDSRYTNDKHHYRENMWIMFSRDKHQWRNYPAFWFEVTPTDYSMGVGLYGNDIGVMNLIRQHIRENPSEFKKIIKKCESTGAVPYGSEYKRIPAGCPKGLEKYYGRKEFGFISTYDTLDDLADPGIIDIIRKNFSAFSPLYSYLLSIADEYFSEGE